MVRKRLKQSSGDYSYGQFGFVLWFLTIDIQQVASWLKDFNSLPRDRWFKVVVQIIVVCFHYGLVLGLKLKLLNRIGLQL